MTKRVLTDALAAGDLPAAVAALDQNVVFHSPILATTGNEVRGHTVVVKILQTAFACFGMPRNVDEFQNYNGRYIVTFDGSIGGNLIQVAILVTENAAGKVESLRVFARPWPIVKLFREFMERNLRPDPVPDAIWNLPATYRDRRARSAARDRRDARRQSRRVDGTRHRRAVRQITGNWSRTEGIKCEQL
jgi:hypothetical protein